MLCSCSARTVNLVHKSLQCIHLQRAFLPIYIVIYSGNFKRVVCLIVAFVCLLCEFHWPAMIENLKSGCLGLLMHWCSMAVEAPCGANECNICVVAEEKCCGDIARAGWYLCKFCKVQQPGRSWANTKTSYSCEAMFASIFIF